MREYWALVGAFLLAVGVLCFFTASEIELQVGILPFSFALITFFVGGLVLVIAGLVSYITDRL